MDQIIAYEIRKDEKPYVDAITKKYKLEITISEDILDSSTVNLIQNQTGISILGNSHIDATLLDVLKVKGITHISTRTIGYNHIDIAHAKELGIEITNINYEPYAVAEFTVMMILMALRGYKAALFRANVNDYSLTGLKGKELRHCTVGIMGTGAIGKAVMNLLQAFGCRIIVYSKNAFKKNLPGVEVVDQDTLFKESDIITMHVPVNKQTYHLINEGNLGLLKDGVVLINCSRGGLFSTQSMIQGIETKKIGAIALDVFENETGVYHFDRRSDIISNRDMAYLRQFPNVIMTQHMAFYTENNIATMVTNSLENLYFDRISNIK